MLKISWDVELMINQHRVAVKLLNAGLNKLTMLNY